MKTLLFCLALVFAMSTFIVRSETIKTSQNTLGESVIFKSTDGDQPFAVTLWVPENTSKKPLPLLVVLDGQRYFNYAISMHHMMQDYEWTPPFAILGVDTSQGRWPMLSGQREAILDKLEKQVFPYLEAKYPISDERILFGWEAAGGFTLKTMIDKPNLFSSYIAASPSPLYGKYFPMLQQEFNNMIATMTSGAVNKHIFVTQGRYDYPQYLGIDELKSALHGITTHKPRYTFTTIGDATHSSLGFESLMRGVRDYFYYFDKPQFNSFEEFTTAGGHQYLDDYFTQQAKEFALNGEQISKNRFEILRKLSFIPLMDGNLPLFQQFINQLSETDFLDRSHVNHIYRYGLFMLENKDLAGAGRLFEYSQKREPDNALPINGLGLVAKARGERQAAKTLFQQAVEMAEMNDDYRISEYKQNLEQLD